MSDPVVKSQRPAPAGGGQAEEFCRYDYRRLLREEPLPFQVLIGGAEPGTVGVLFGAGALLQIDICGVN